MAYLCHGDFQGTCYRRLDDDGGLIQHRIVGGGSVWETHGSPDGHIRHDIEVGRGDAVVCCYPQAVKQRYPDAPIVLSGHGGTVLCVYGPGLTEGTYTVTVTAE